MASPWVKTRCKLVKRAYDWPENAKFLVPDGVLEHFADGIGQRGGEARRDWEAMFAKYRERFPDLATEIDQMQRRELPAGWDRNLPSFPPDPKGMAGRDASGQVLNVLAQNIPWFLGGSADLGIIKQDVAQIRRRRGIRSRHARRPQYSFRHPRARDGGDRQRAVALEAAGVRRDLLHLQRLRAAGHSALRADGTADHFRFHA